MALPSWAHFSWSVLATTLAAVAAAGMAGAPPGSEVPAQCVSAHIIAADPETRTLTLDIRNSCQAAVTALSWTISCPEAARDRGDYSERLDFFSSIGLESWVRGSEEQPIGGIAPRSLHRRKIPSPCVVGGSRQDGPGVRVKAFLLADKTAWGDLQDLRRIMHARRVTLDELRYWTETLESALSDIRGSDTALPLEALAAKSRLKRYENDALGSLVANGVQQDVFRHLRAAPENRSNPERIAAASVLRLLTAYRDWIEVKARHVFEPQ
jgi:hypothetical protein